MPHRNREPDPGNTRPTPPPTRPLPFDDSDPACDRDGSVSHEAGPVPPVSGEPSAPGRVSRFARVFGALGGSRGSVQRPSGHETAASGRDGRTGSAQENAAAQQDSHRDSAGPRRAPRDGGPGYPARDRPGAGASEREARRYADTPGAWAGDSTDRAGYRRRSGSGAEAGRIERPGATPLASSRFGTGGGPGPFDALDRDHRVPGDYRTTRPADPGYRPGEKIRPDESRRSAAESGGPPGTAGPAGPRSAAGPDRPSRDAGRPASGANRAEPAGRDEHRPGGARDSGSRAPRSGGSAEPPAGPRYRPASEPHEPGPGDPAERFAATKEYRSADLDPEYDADDRRLPRKLTVTRVAAMRGRELTEKGIATFRRAAEADGADKSGLTALTYATMANFALDAAIAGGGGGGGGVCGRTPPPRPRRRSGPPAPVRPGSAVIR